MKLNLVPISSERFNYFGDLKSFVAEHSDLNGYDIRQSLYDDACDVGFEIISEKTGESRIFLFTNQNNDNEGDVISWTFTMLNKDGSKSNVIAEIFND